MVSTIQEEIILTLVQGASGRAWARGLEGWSTSATYTVCYWEGIICDDEHQTTVVGILLPKRDFGGTLPPELGLLTSLNEIDMPGNMIHGTIPKEIAELPALQIIDLGSNQITGTIPVFKSTELKSIDLGNNQLTGSIPEKIGTRCRKMTDFDVQGNKLSGQIPNSFSQLISMNTLSLSRNEFSGTIPPALGDIEAFEYLYLDSNNLMGTLPPQLARSGSSLKELWLEHNMLSGTIPAVFADLEDMFNFYIDGNKFTGTIPQELCREEINKDFYQGIDPDIERDYCDSIACPAGHVSEDGLYPCDVCNEQYFNPYLGRVGKCIDMDQKDILAIFHEATRIGTDSYWDLTSDDYCNYVGVTCDKSRNVNKLSLSGKELHGTIPEEIGFLRYLQELDLSDNHLTGFLPSDLRFAPLTKLDVTGNQLKGIVPELLCDKTGLNGNGNNGEFSCSNIACPVGSYSASGRSQCRPCPGNLFLGSKHCDSSPLARSPNADGIGSVGYFFIFFLVLVGTAGIIFMAFMCHKKQENRQLIQSDDDDEWHVALDKVASDRSITKHGEKQLFQGNNVDEWDIALEKFVSECSNTKQEDSQLLKGEHVDEWGVALDKIAAERCIT